jgi:hypothetical protein
MYLPEALLAIVLSPFRLFMITEGALIHSTWRYVFIKPTALVHGCIISKYRVFQKGLNDKNKFPG